VILIQGMRTGKTALLKMQSNILESKKKYYNETGYIPNEIRMNYKEYEFIEAYYSSLIEFKKQEAYIYDMRIQIDNSVEELKVNHIFNDKIKVPKNYVDQLRQEIIDNENYEEFKKDFFKYFNKKNKHD
jgi:hypothetical protein